MSMPFIYVCLLDSDLLGVTVTTHIRKYVTNSMTLYHDANVYNTASFDPFSVSSSTI